MAERDDFTLPDPDTLHRLAVRLDAYASRAEQSAEALARLPDADPSAREAEGQVLRMAANIVGLLAGIDGRTLERKLDEAVRESLAPRRAAR